MQIHIQHLWKRFGSHDVLKDICLKKDDIHALVLIGPSGSGKTTLLRCLSGLIQPDQGSVSINNTKLPSDEEALRDYRKHVGMVFQSYNLFPHLSALQNILLPLEKVHGKTYDEAMEIAQRMLKRFRLEEQAHKKPYQLSGGQQQRIALSRSIAIAPEFLVLDEPTSALDPELTVEVLDMIKELRQEDIHLILATHHMGFVTHVADYICFLEDGRLATHGHAQEILKSSEHPSVQNFLTQVLKY